MVHWTISFAFGELLLTPSRRIAALSRG